MLINYVQKIFYTIAQEIHQHYQYIAVVKYYHLQQKGSSDQTEG